MVEPSRGAAVLYPRPYSQSRSSLPVLNEAHLIAPFLQNLRANASDAELIVVDGGSEDGTREAAEEFCDQLVISKPGRAGQLNRGAQAAHGEVLWFLHVDSHVPAGCLDAIRGAVSDVRVAGGYFRIRLPKTHFVYRLTDSFAHYAGILLRMRCGDHGFFCRSRVFFHSGGFPEVLLMEDVEFYRVLHRFGRVCRLPLQLRTSARRYEQFGPIRVTFAYGLIAILYVLRVPIPRLARLYRWACE